MLAPIWMQGKGWIANNGKPRTALVRHSQDGKAKTVFHHMHFFVRANITADGYIVVARNEDVVVKAACYFAQARMMQL